MGLDLSNELTNLSKSLGLKDAGDSVGDFIQKDLANALTDAYESVANTLTSLGEGVTDGFKQAIEWVSEGLTTLAQDIGRGIQNFVNWVGDSFAELGDRLVSGLAQAINWTLSTVVGLVQSLLGALGELFSTDPFTWLMVGLAIAVATAFYSVISFAGKRKVAEGGASTKMAMSEDFEFDSEFSREIKSLRRDAQISDTSQDLELETFTFDEDEVLTEDF